MTDLTLIIPTKKEVESLPIFLKEIASLEYKKIIVLQKEDIETKKAIKGFKNDVDTNKFPNSNHTISMNDGELELFIKQLST